MVEGLKAEISKDKADTGLRMALVLRKDTRVPQLINKFFSHGMPHLRAELMGSGFWAPQ